MVVPSAIAAADRRLWRSASSRRFSCGRGTSGRRLAKRKAQQGPVCDRDAQTGSRSHHVVSWDLAVKPPPPPPPHHPREYSAERKGDGTVRGTLQRHHEPSYSTWEDRKPFILGAALIAAVTVVILPLAFVSNLASNKNTQNAESGYRRKRFNDAELGVEGESVRNKETGEWEFAIAYKADEDPLTGEKAIAILIRSTDETSNVIGMKEHASLGVRCQDGKVDALLRTPSFNADNSTVYLRWDDGEIEEESWRPSGTGNGLFAPDPVQFIGRALLHKKVVMGWMPYQQTRSAATFSLVGLDSYIEKMRDDGCPTDLPKT